MVVFARKHAAPWVQGRAAEDLCLRVVNTARRGQVVRLSSPKCTIGSARGCTLRLQAVGVRPLHCLILRGARGTVARCWSGGTRLNGERFVDARLSAGDRLAVGPIELEVITAAEADALRHEASDDAGPETRAPEQGHTDEQGLPAARQRARRLIATIRDLRTELEQLRRQPPAPEAASAEVPTLEANVDSRLEAFQRGCRQWEESRSAREAELDARARGLEADLRDLEAARGALSAERKRWEQDHELSRRIREERDAASAEAQRRLTEARHAFDQQQRELDAQREELSRCTHELEQQRAELPARFAAQLAELEREQTGWNAQHAESVSELAAARQSLEQERSEWRQRATEQDVVYQQRLREMAEQGAQLAAEREALAQREAHVATSEAQYLSEREEIQQLRAELDRRPGGEHQQIDSERQQRLEELERLGSQLAEQQAQAQQQQDALAAAQDRLERALADLEVQREKLDAERLAAADRLARESAELQRQRAELEQQQAALEGERAAGTVEAVEPARVEEDDEEEKVKELVSSLRSRLAAAAEEDDDEEEEADDEPRARLQPADEDEDEEDEDDDAMGQHQSAGRGGDTKTADDDMSVEEYMKGLLSRARGGQPAVASSQAPPPQRRNKRKSDAPAKAVEAKPEATPEPVSVAQVIDMPEAPLQLVRRVPVQQTADFGAMRELANTQARIAIDLHGKKRLLRIAVGSITGAALAMAVTLTVLFVVSDDVALRTGSMVGIVAAVYWMYGGTTALQKMMGLQQTSRAELLAQLAQAEARKS